MIFWRNRFAQKMLAYGFQRGEEHEFLMTFMNPNSGETLSIKLWEADTFVNAVVKANTSMVANGDILNMIDEAFAEAKTGTVTSCALCGEKHKDGKFIFFMQDVAFCSYECFDKYTKPIKKGAVLPK